jgi:hypothetical protein
MLMLPCSTKGYSMHKQPEAVVTVVPSCAAGQQLPACLQHAATGLSCSWSGWLDEGSARSVNGHSCSFLCMRATYFPPLPDGISGKFAYFRYYDALHIVFAANLSNRLSPASRSTVVEAAPERPCSRQTCAMHKHTLLESATLLANHSDNRWSGPFACARARLVLQEDTSAQADPPRRVRR